MSAPVLLTRRAFGKTMGGFTCGIAATSWSGCAGISRGRKKTDIRIEHVNFDFDEQVYRAPVAFAGAVMDRATLMTVRCSVRAADGNVASGFGTMPFNHIFSFPSKRLSDETKNNAMKALAGELSRVTGSYQEFAHPIEINWDLAPLYFQAAARVSAQLQLA